MARISFYFIGIIFVMITQRVSATGDYGPDTCMEGFVWREACGPNDHVCVVPDTRDQAQQDNALAARRIQPGGGPYGPDTCRQGFVWREACGPSDHVCVTPETRDISFRDNQEANQRKKYPFCLEYAKEAIATAVAASTAGCPFSGLSNSDEYFKSCLYSTNENIFKMRQYFSYILTTCRQ